MALTRRHALSASLGAMAGGSIAGSWAQTGGGARPKLKLGIITDLAGPYADLNRPSMACAQQALEDFDVAGRGWDVEILLGQHFDKADNAVTIARQWFDREGVDAVLDVNTSARCLTAAAFSPVPSAPFAAPAPAQGDAARTLRMVPQADVMVLDPLASGMLAVE
jgi:branched-chain amino acid transport system substrate-binding protein